MPTIYTCSFARAKLLPADVPAVSIARYPPRTWGKGLRCMALAPPADLLRAIKADAISWEEYSTAYRTQLATLDPQAIAAQLDGSALLCFCQPGRTCHRRLAAEWLESSLGIVIPEYGFSRAQIFPSDDAPEPGELPPWSIDCDHCSKPVPDELTATDVLCCHCGRTFEIVD